VVTSISLVLACCLSLVNLLRKARHTTAPAGAQEEEEERESLRQGKE
jgi:hypothetical protein